MASVAIKTRTVGPDPLYQDGDVISFASSAATSYVHAQMLCGLRRQRKNRDGLNPPGCLGDHLLLHTRRFRFDRAGREVVRTNIRTGRQQVFGEKPDAEGKYIHVDLYLAEKTAWPTHSVFGVRGREYWYGGNTYLEGASQVWPHLERRLGVSRWDYRHWPYTQLDKSVALCLPVTDPPPGTNLAAKVFAQGRWGPYVVKKRARAFDWRRHLWVRESRVLDRNRPVDLMGMRQLDWRLLIVKPDVEMFDGRRAA